MPRRPAEPLTPVPSPEPDVPFGKPSPDGTDEGMLDLDDEDQINNQHLEVR
jgi:hypothetical protein